MPVAKNPVNCATKQVPVRHLHVSFFECLENRQWAFSAISQGQARRGRFCHEDEASGA